MQGRRAMVARLPLSPWWLATMSDGSRLLLPCHCCDNERGMRAGRERWRCRGERERPQSARDEPPGHASIQVMVSSACLMPQDGFVEHLPAAAGRMLWDVERRRSGKR